MLAPTGLPLATGVWQSHSSPGLLSQVVSLGTPQEVTLSILHHPRLKSWAGKGLLLPLWAAEQETKEGMEEGVIYADLRFPPTTAPQQLVRLPWCWAALSLSLLSLMLLLAQIILVSLSFHYLVQQQTSCTHSLWSIEESSSYEKQTLEGRCQFCPVGWLWEARQCYYFSSTRKSWEHSREDCCSRGAQLVTIQANTTLAFLLHTANMDVFHVGLKQDGFRSDWKWLDGTTLEGIFPIQRYTRSSQACGRVSGLGLLGGACTEALRWVCKQSAATLQWIQSSPPAFLWGNTTYSCVEP